jgi:hypothetical protein
MGTVMSTVMSIVMSIIDECSDECSDEYGDEYSEEYSDEHSDEHSDEYSDEYGDEYEYARAVMRFYTACRSDEVLTQPFEIKRGGVLCVSLDLKRRRKSNGYTHNG